MKNSTITINGLAWTEDGRRKEKPCSVCTKPTHGRIENEAYCLDCAMPQLMKPIGAIKQSLTEALLKGFIYFIPLVSQRSQNIRT
jgi:hypothetical protein